MAGNGNSHGMVFNIGGESVCANEILGISLDAG